MKIFPLISILLLTLQLCRADEKLWKGNRLTADQPFPAKVIGVAHTWVGYELLLEEVGVKKPRYCYTLVSSEIHLKYTLTTKMASPKLRLKWMMLPSGIPVSEFQYSKGGDKLGEKYGDDDLLRQAVAIKKSAEDGARQPAAAPDSKSEGKEKAKPESEVRPK